MNNLKHAILKHFNMLNADTWLIFSQVLVYYW